MRPVEAISPGAAPHNDRKLGRTIPTVGQKIHLPRPRGAGEGGHMVACLARAECAAYPLRRTDSERLATERGPVGVGPSLTAGAGPTVLGSRDGHSPVPPAGAAAAVVVASTGGRS